MAQSTIQEVFDLAGQHHRAGRLQEAENLYRQILARQPQNPHAIHLLGVIAHQMRRNDVALDLIRRAIALHPNFPEAYSNLGSVLKNQGQLDEALAAYRQAVALNANAFEVFFNIGGTLHAQGKFDEAIAAYRQAIALRPDYPEAHHGLSLSLLTIGDLEQGWKEYEWRSQCKDFPPRKIRQPMWDGSDLGDRTILLYTEQGFGDAIQFIRYWSLVAQRGGKIIIGCPPELQRLFQIAAGGCQIVTNGRQLPAFDFHCPVLSLPRVLGTTRSSIPNSAPYLRADPDDAAKWQRRMNDHSSRAKVGLAWSGRPTHTNDQNRSVSLKALAPLARASDVSFFNLQKGAAAEQAKDPPAGMELIDWTSDLNDFADTAALIANLDLVIAVDTAVVHLAGAMGKPVWTLLPFLPDWRWALEQDRSPWYPTMRLFRQPAKGDWDSVVARVADALSIWVKDRAV